MSKTITYILILALLAFGVWYFIFKDKDIFSINEAGFKLTDTAAISKIFMADKKGNTILLERKNNSWRVNDKYPAMFRVINLLLETIATQNSMYPVPQTMHNTVVTILAGQGTKVELYNKRGEKMRVFYVGGQANSNQGTFMLMEGAGTPYVVQIPAFEGYIAPRYSTDVADWRDRTICDIPSGALKAVHLEYITEPIHSFMLQQDEQGKVVISADSSIIKGKELNKRRAGVYTKFFERLSCEGYINGVYKLDSIIGSTPKYCVLDVSAKDGSKQHLEVYWMPLNRRSKNLLSPAPGVPEQYDADRFYATMNDFKDTILIQRNTFDKIFRKAIEFYQPDDTITKQLPLNMGAGSFKIKGK